MVRNKNNTAKLQPVELNIFQRVAFSDVDTIRKAQRFLQNHGYVKAKDQHDLADLLGIAVHEGGEGIIPEFISLHPDIEFFKNQKLPKAELIEQLNACGCSAMLASDGETIILPKEEKKDSHKAEAQPQQTQATLRKFEISEHMPLVFITGVICVTIAAIALNKN